MEVYKQSGHSEDSRDFTIYFKVIDKKLGFQFDFD